MAVAWFIAPYKRSFPGPPPERYCAMNDFTVQILADGGFWSETEILGDVALVKVRASAATLTTISAASGFLRIPNHFDLNDTLGDLTVGQRNAILAEALTLGYTQTEIDNALPANWQNVTLGQVLRFFARRRLKPSYDAGSDTIVFTAEESPVRPVAHVDASVANG